MRPVIRPERVPLPSSFGRLPPLAEAAVEGWRLHWEEDIAKPPRHATGIHRFDAPAGEYAVTYLNVDVSAAFAEVYGDLREIAPNQADRRISTVRATAPLRVVDLDNPETLAALDLDLKISASKEYSRTMLWSRAFHEWYPEAHGIRYIGRHAAHHLNYCLFLDRCGDKISSRLEGKMSGLRSVVLEAADTYHLVPRLFQLDDPATGL